MKKILFAFLIFLIVSGITSAMQETFYPSKADTLLTGFAAREISQRSNESDEKNQKDLELDVSAGLTPDSFFYFIDEWLESRSENDPAKALAYRKEKIAEGLTMAKKGKKEEAKHALEKARAYGLFIEKETTPPLAKEVEASAPAVEHALKDIVKDIPDLENETTQEIAQEKKIVLATTVAKKIKDLCETLAQLDPLQYSQTCKATEKSPTWLKEQDEELTEEQEEHVKRFSKNMQKCLKDPSTCDCTEFGVKKLEAVCEQQKKNAIECTKDKTKCSETDVDPRDYLPDYLILIYEKHVGVVKKEQEQMLSPECAKAGVKTKEACVRFMFETGAPKECLDAGLTGDSEDDIEKCKNIMKGAKKKQEQKASFNKDCYAIEKYEEKKKCFEKLSVYADAEILDSAKYVCPNENQLDEIKQKCTAYGGTPKEKKEKECTFIECDMPSDAKQKMMDQYKTKEKQRDKPPKTEAQPPLIPQGQTKIPPETQGPLTEQQPRYPTGQQGSQPSQSPVTQEPITTQQPAPESTESESLDEQYAETSDEEYTDEEEPPTNTKGSSSPPVQPISASESGTMQEDTSEEDTSTSDEGYSEEEEYANEDDFTDEDELA